MKNKLQYIDLYVGYATCLKNKYTYTYFPF
jgi:hypothetical protein